MKSEAMANTTLFHTAELRAINARSVMRVGAQFAKPIPRLAAKNKGDFLSRLQAYAKKL